MNIDYWINRRTLRQEIALSKLDYYVKEKVQAIINNVPGVDLSERDEGKEPVLETRTSTMHQINADGTGEFISRDYTDWMCPVCGWFVGELYSGHGRWHIQCETSYCARCGQRIDWTKPAEEEKMRYEERKEKEREEWEAKHKILLDNMREGRRRKYGMLNESEVE